MKFLLLLNIVFLVQPAFSTVCTTAGCRRASSDILSFIDPSVNPCEDFYKFICGSPFVKTYETKPVSLRAMITREVEEQTTIMLLRPTDVSEPKAIQSLKVFFRVCMDEVSLETNGIGTLLTSLEQLGGWPVLKGESWNDDEFSFDRLLIKLRRMGMDFMQLFYFGTTVGEEEQTLLISEPAIQNIEAKDKENYHDYLIEVAMLLGANKQSASTELQEMLLFKMKLLRILENAGQMNKTTIKCIQEEFPFLHWLRFLNTIIFPNKKLSENDEVYLPSFEYLSDLDNLLKETSNRTLANYIIWQAIESVIPFLPNRFKRLKESYDRSVLNDEGQLDESEPRLDFCKKESRRLLPPTYEALYIKEYYSPDKRQKAEEVVSFLKMELISFVNSTDLYDEEARDKMLEKAKAVTYIVGAPEKLFDSKLMYEIFDEKEDLNTNDLLTILSILNRQRENFRLKIGNGVNHFSYYEETAVMNTFYESFRNTLDVPAAVLQGFFFQDKRPKCLNYGTIGAIASIELIRGFTQAGSRFDKNGNLASLWTDETRKNFNNKAECLIKAADNFSIDDSFLRMDGKRTLEKNLCDHTGVDLAYRAYNSWIKKHGEENRLPGLRYTPKQLFWIGVASTFCDTVPVYKLKEFVEEGPQAVPAFRTFGVMSNSAHFAEDFRCSVNSKMNAAYKCKVF